MNRPSSPGKRLLGLAVGLSLFLTVTACGDDDDTADSSPPGTVQGSEPDQEAGGDAERVSIRFTDVVRSPLYAPAYIALTEGFFEAEGLDVEIQTANGGDRVTAMLVAGEADIAMVGPDTTVFVNTNPEGEVKLKVFGLQVLSDGAFLVSREPVEDFSWDDVRGSTIIGFRPGSMPENVLETVLVENGLEIGTDVEVRTDLGAPTNVSAFIEGQGDFLLWVEPQVTELINDGTAHFAASMADEIGEVPYTGYTATEDYLAENPDVIERWMRAVQAANRWMHEATSEEVAASIISLFPEVSEEVLAGAVDRYREAGVWPDGDVGVPDESQIERLQDILVDRGVLEESARLEYTEIIDGTFTNSG